MLNDHNNLPPLAIVGMDCCLPGAANLEQFRQLLFSGQSGIAELPGDRLQADLYFDCRRGQAGRTYTKLGGTVPPQTIDFSLLGCSSEAAHLIDPVHLRFCEVAVRAWKSVGFQAHDPTWKQAGVFVGHSGATQHGGDLALATQIEEGLDFLNDLPIFQQLPPAVQTDVLNAVTKQVRVSRPRRAPGKVPAYQAYTAASLPARVLGFEGPRIVCDAACASSLFAMQQAITAIRLGRIDAAIVGGATTNGVDNLILFSQSQACSETGSAPFDQSASGLVSSEGYAAVVIVPQTIAQRLQLPILGLISGLGIASDGRGKSLWAPRAEGQELAIRRAYSGEPPLSIDYLEAHATSTQLGDATELQAVHAIRQAEHPRATVPLWIGSLKSNLGHTLETAGVAGLIKILLAMQQGEIPASLHFHEPNQNFDWSARTVEVVSCKRPWQARQDVKRAAVSAFGIGGLNAHLLVQESPAGTPQAPAFTNQTPANQSRVSRSASTEPIAIVGRGVVLPGAHQMEQFKALLANGNSMIGPPPHDRWRAGVGVLPGAERGSFRTPHAQGGFIRDYLFDSQRYRIPPKQVQQANPLQMQLLDAVTQAIEEMDRGNWNVDRRKTGVVIGTIFSGDFGNQLQLGLRLPEIEQALQRELQRRGMTDVRILELLQQYRQFILKARPALLDETGSFTASTLASRIAKTFDLMGGACALDVDDASGSAALNMAVDQLRAGTWDMAVCGAADRAMDLNKFEQLDLTGKLLRSGRAEELPADCSRILPGEGVVVLLLERLSTAQQAGHPVFGIIEEIKTQWTPGQADPGTIMVSDRDCELVRQIGYLTGAHSLVQLVKQTIQWESGQNSKESISQRSWITACTKDGLHYQVQSRPAEFLEPGRQMATGETSGQRTGDSATSSPAAMLPNRTTNRVEGDANSGIESVNQSTRPAEHYGTSDPLQTLRLFRFQGETEAQLLSCIDAAIAQPQASFERPLRNYDGQQTHRLSMLAEDVRQLKDRLAALRRNWSRSRAGGVFETERAIKWKTRPEVSRVAWVFPGQGVQYAGIPDAVKTSPVVATALADLDRQLGRIGLESFTKQLETTTSYQMSDIWWNQLWVLGLSLAFTAELQAHGLRPDVLLGHSFGDFAALTAAGSLTSSQVLRMVKARADAVVRAVCEKGQLISVRGTCSGVEAVIRRENLPATITHYNAPQQTVIATDCDQVNLVRKALTAANFASIPVSVPVAFHTARLAGAEQILKETYARERFLPPVYGYFSTTMARYQAEPAELQQTLVTQMTLPVLYAAAIERLLSDDVTVLIEVGPNQILSRLNTEITGDRALCLSLDLPGRSHAERLLLVQAAMEIVKSETTPGPATRAMTDRPAMSVSATTVEQRRTNFHPTSQVDDVEIVDLHRPFRQAKQESREKPTPIEQTNAGPGSQQSAPVLTAVSHSSRQDDSSRTESPCQTDGPTLADVRHFLLTVIVDLTGYSPDVIDFDADLEADLGIDSIKKAQVVGELAEYFELSVAPSGITLSDLHTLNDLAAIGVQFGISQSDATLSAPATTSALSDVIPTPAISVPNIADPITSSLSHLNFRLGKGEADNNGTESRETDPNPKLPSSTSLPAGMDLASIERFLIDLVVDQTGYSPEVVDLDADMEGDLGIDSIKQAQLLGELQQQFELSTVAASGQSRTSFSTLRSILNYLAEVLPVNGSTAFRVAVPETSITQKEAAEPSGGSKKNSPAFHLEQHAIGVTPCDVISPKDQQLFMTTGNVMAAGDGLDQEVWFRGWQRGQKHSRAIRNTLKLLIDLKHHSSVGQPPETHVAKELAGLAAGAGVSLSAVLHAHGLFQREQCERDSPAAKEVAAPFRSTGTMRFAMRMVPAPQRAGMPTQPTFSGPALILGRNALAREIQQQFEKEGHAAHLVPPVQTLKELDHWIDQLWSDELTPHLFITTSYDADALQKLDARIWQQRRFAAIEVPYRVCQLWMQRMIAAGKMDGSSVVAALNLGGDFGLSGHSCISPEGGLGGLIKAMLIEAWMRGFRTTSMKVIDLSPRTTTSQAVTGIWRELAVPSYDMEVSWHGSERSAIQPVHQPLLPEEDSNAGFSACQPLPIVDVTSQPAGVLPADEETRIRTSQVRTGGTWVVTGGARGITAVVVRELALRHGLKLHLLGTAPEPQVTEQLRQSVATDRLQVRRTVMADAARRGKNGMEAWRNIEKSLEIDATLRACRADGIEATYHCCDVSDLPRLEATLAKIRHLDGPLAGVIHGAGIGQDARFDRKRPDKVDQCFRAKIDGCLNLMDATRHDPLDSFVAFGSISGRFGANGHTDYSFANDSLAKLVDRYRRERPEVTSVTFHWHAWGEIGMATKPETKLALEMINLEFMPAREGIIHFLNELEWGGKEPEVLITDRASCRKFFPVDRSASLKGTTTSQTRNPDSVSFPLLDPAGECAAPHAGTFAITLHPEEERFLNQHRVQGKPTLPFVVALELMAEAARSVTGLPHILEARNVQALQAIKWATSDPRTIHVRATTGAAGVNCALVADVRRRDGRIIDTDHTYFQGTMQAGQFTRIQNRQNRSNGTLPDLSTLNWIPIQYPEPDAMIYHGPDLRCLQAVAMREDQAYGRISASSTVQLGGGRRPISGWSVHCAAMDACLYAAALFAGQRYGRVSLPVLFDRIRFGRLPDPGEPCLVTIQLISESANGLDLAFQLMGFNADVLLDVEGYRLGWISVPQKTTVPSTQENVVQNHQFPSTNF